MNTTSEDGVVTLERRGHVLRIGLNRPEKRNAFNIELLIALGRAYELLERDDDLRCGATARAHWRHPGDLAPTDAPLDGTAQDTA